MGNIPTVETLNRMVLYALDFYENTHQSGASSVEICWLLGQNTVAENEIKESLEELVSLGVAAERNGLFYCISLYGIDKKH